MSEPQSLKAAMQAGGITDDQRATMQRILALVPSDFRMALHGVPEAYQHGIVSAWAAHQLKWQKLAKRWGCTPPEAEARARSKWERIAKQRALEEEKRWREAQAAKEKPSSTRSPTW